MSLLVVLDRGSFMSYWPYLTWAYFCSCWFYFAVKIVTSLRVEDRLDGCWVLELSMF